MPDCAILASTPGCAIGDRVSKSSETLKPRTGWPTCPSLGHGGWEGSPSAGCRSAAPSLAPEIGTMGAWESEIQETPQYKTIPEKVTIDYQTN